MRRPRKSRTFGLRRPSPSGMAWMLALAAAAALHVWMHLKTTELGYELGTIRQVLLRLAGEKAELEVELATLASPKALDRAARARLGMRAPKEGQVVGVP